MNVSRFRPVGHWDRFVTFFFKNVVFQQLGLHRHLASMWGPCAPLRAPVGARCLPLGSPWSPFGRPWPLDQVTLAMRDHISVFAIVSCLGCGLESSHVKVDSMTIFIMYFFGFGLRCGLGHFQSE